MKVFISADIEGIGCVVGGDHSRPENRDYHLARKWMTEEVNAAAQGAFDAGASEIVVIDAHNQGLNILPDDLDDRIRIILGSPRPLGMMEGIDQGFDAAFFVGYHPMMGTPNGVINHTYTGRVAELHMNDRHIGEIGLNSALAGHFGVPVALVTGDRAATLEARALIPEVETAAVKQGIGSYAALCHHPKKCREMIYKAARRAMDNITGLSPFSMAGPVVVKVRFTTASTADQAMVIPGTERVDGFTVQYPGRDYLEAFKAFMAMAGMIKLTPFI